MMKLWDPVPENTPPAVIATTRKRLLPNLDALVPDERIAVPVQKDRDAETERLSQPGEESEGEPLTLVTALLGARKVAEALEAQLSLVLPTLSPRAKKQLEDELPNRRDGLLHTMSELGLTLELMRRGWAVECARRFWGAKDVDIAATRGRETRLVEVVNLQARPLVNTATGFIPLQETRALTDEIVRRVARKVLRKYRPAREAGWSGRGWIAIDATKDDEKYVGMRILEGRTADWRSTVTERLAPQFPELEGVVFYSYSASSPIATDLRWHPCGP